MDVLGPDNISDDHETIALARLFQNGEETVAGPRRTKKSGSPVVRTSDKVQVVRAVSAMQAAGHKAHGTGSIVPALAKTQGRGTHGSVTGRNQHRKGGPAADQRHDVASQRWS